MSIAETETYSAEWTNRHLVVTRKSDGATYTFAAELGIRARFLKDVATHGAETTFRAWLSTTGKPIVWSEA